MKDEIKKLKKEKDAIILAHYYVDGEVQDIADFVGDSLELSRKASQASAKIIVFAGVHFMAETAKILSPDKKILIPDINSGCPLADSMPLDKFKVFKQKYHDYFVINYVNSTAEIKAMSDLICTSSNAVELVKTLPSETKILFGPDRNLGRYVKSFVDNEMIIWDGFCPIHEEFSGEKLLKLKKQYPEAIVLAHPEANKDVLLHSDIIGSTSKILKTSIENSNKQFIIATEPGIIHMLKKKSPTNQYIPLPPISDNSLSICHDMKKHTLENLRDALKYEQYEIIMDDDLIEKAIKPISRMINISLKLKLIK
ncbi:MAG: quinolinate synthase NadA [Bacteroidota bacterium]|nr:quinolinate synthase NadA [Bacteroidota bacterium]